jgi:uncharacterized protein (DUF2252 family)
MTRAERRERGRAERKRVPRRSHAGFTPAPDRTDPLALVDQQNRSRLPDIVPVRWGRMAQSVFGWLRGSPVVMTSDLASTPTTSLAAQLCGDAHLLNFGLYGGSAHNQVFDVSDFDETLPGPFEWDVKRLAASAVVASATAAFPPGVARRAALTVARSYRERMARYASSPVLDVWYDCIDVDEALATVRPVRRSTLERGASAARRQSSLSVLPKLTEVTGTGRRIRDRPPLVHHVDDPRLEGAVADLIERYRSSMPDSLRPLVDRFELVDVALTRAHARTGDPVAVSAYLGSGTVFDEAIAAFAVEHLVVAARDHEVLVDAVRAGRITTIDR